MKLSSGQYAFLDSLPQRFIARMPKEPSAKGLEGILDSVSQLVADPPSLLNGKLEVLLQPTRGRILGVLSARLRNSGGRAWFRSSSPAPPSKASRQWPLRWMGRD